MAGTSGQGTSTWKAAPDYARELASTFPGTHWYSRATLKERKQLMDQTYKWNFGCRNPGRREEGQDGLEANRFSRGLIGNKIDTMCQYMQRC